MVSMDPTSVGRGAAEFTRHGETMDGHVSSVVDMAALQAAFAGAGEEAWQQVQASLTDLQSRLEAVRQRTTDAGTVLANFVEGVTGIDLQHGDSMGPQQK